MQDNWSNWDHMRHTRSHKRQHEPNETPRHSAAHTHLRGNSSAPLTALDPPISQPQASATIGVHFRPKPEGTILRHNPWEPKAQSLGTEGLNLRYPRNVPWDSLVTEGLNHLSTIISSGAPQPVGSGIIVATIFEIVAYVFFRRLFEISGDFGLAKVTFQDDLCAIPRILYTGIGSGWRCPPKRGWRVI